MVLNWYSNIYNAFLIVGVIILLCTVGSSTSAGISGSITGYSFLIIGILLLIGYLMKKMQSNPNSNILTSIITFGPFLVFLGILIYMIYLLGVNFNKIASGNISSSYYNFMYIFIVLLMVQIYIFYNSIQSVQFKTTSTINSVTSTLIYLLELVNIIVVITIGIILKYFSTDG